METMLLPLLTLRRRGRVSLRARHVALLNAALPELLEPRRLLSGTAFLAPTTVAAGTPASVTTSGAFNNNAYNEDLVIVGSGGIYLAPGNGDGTFGAATKIAPDTGVAAVLADDVNFDGNLDLLAANPADGT